MKISPNFNDTDFSYPLSIDDKITIFEDRTLGWKLEIADMIINGKKSKNGELISKPIPDSGIVVLDIVFSYFEMIAKYEDGYQSIYDGRKYFDRGIELVFPMFLHRNEINEVPGVEGKVVSILDEMLDILYKGVRCGLYHSGIIEQRVILTGVTNYPISFEPQDFALIINPHLFVPWLINHFASYIQQLRDTNNSLLRTSFEKRFDFVNGLDLEQD